MTIGVSGGWNQMGESTDLPAQKRFKMIPLGRIFPYVFLKDDGHISGPIPGLPDSSPNGLLLERKWVLMP